MILPEVAIGAVLAALIGGMISLAGLIIGKETKVAEFRQNWINDLRAEVATFLTHLNALEDASQINFTDDINRFEKTKDSVSNLNQSYFTIALRLNPDEPQADLVKRSMLKLSSLVLDHSRDQAAVNQEKSNLIVLSGALLKIEWQRVRDGERTYRRTKAIATILIASTSIFLLVITVLNMVNRNETPKTLTPSSQMADEKVKPSYEETLAVHKQRRDTDKTNDSPQNDIEGVKPTAKVIDRSQRR